MFGKVKEEELKRYVVMSKGKFGENFYQDRAFKTVEDADAYAKLMQKQEGKDGHEYYLFEQSKHYGNGKDKCQTHI